MDRAGKPLAFPPDGADEAEAQEVADLLLALEKGDCRRFMAGPIAMVGHEPVVLFSLGEDRPRRHAPRIVRLAVQALEADPPFLPSVTAVVCHALRAAAAFAEGLIPAQPQQGAA